MPPSPPSYCFKIAFDIFEHPVILCFFPLNSKYACEREYAIQRSVQLNSSAKQSPETHLKSSGHTVDVIFKPSTIKTLHKPVAVDLIQNQPVTLIQ